MEVKLLNSCGYCTGIKNAFLIIEKIKKEYPTKKIHILGGLVHNKNTNDRLKNDGIDVLVDYNKEYLLNAINKFNSEKDIVIFNCDGYHRDVLNALKKKNILYFDTTCPIVKKNYIDGKKENNIVYFGNKNHQETYNFLSNFEKSFLIENIDSTNDIPFKEFALLNQTTGNEILYNKLKKEILRKYSNVKIYNNFCKVTKNRAKEFIDVCNTENFDYIFVVGDYTSSNTSNLVSLYQNTFEKDNISIINDERDLTNFDFTTIKKALILSGTSASIDDCIQVYNFLKTK